MLTRAGTQPQELGRTIGAPASTTYWCVGQHPSSSQHACRLLQHRLCPSRDYPPPLVQHLLAAQAAQLLGLRLQRGQPSQQHPQQPAQHLRCCSSSLSVTSMPSSWGQTMRLCGPAWQSHKSCCPRAMHLLLVQPAGCSEVCWQAAELEGGFDVSCAWCVADACCLSVLLAQGSRPASRLGCSNSSSSCRSCSASKATPSRSLSQPS